MNYTMEPNGAEISKRSYSLAELKVGKWYKVQDQINIIGVFKEPNKRSEVIGYLAEDQMFMLIQQLGSLSPTDDTIYGRKWVCLGFGEQFGYAYFFMRTRFREVIPSEG
jgi:hypothetical protein